MPTLNWIGKAAAATSLLIGIFEGRAIYLRYNGILKDLIPDGGNVLILFISYSMILEYKGGDRWQSAQDDRDIGELWAALSSGSCRFLKVKKDCLSEIDAAIA